MITGWKESERREAKWTKIENWKLKRKRVMSQKLMAAAVWLRQAILCEDSVQCTHTWRTTTDHFHLAFYCCTEEKVERLFRRKRERERVRNRKFSVHIACCVPLSPNELSNKKKHTNTHTPFKNLLSLSLRILNLIKEDFAVAGRLVSQSVHQSSRSNEEAC